MKAFGIRLHYIEFFLFGCLLEGCKDLESLELAALD